MHIDVPEKRVVFIAGIIQGSIPNGVHDQGYRQHIADLIVKNYPELEVFDPVKKYPASLSYPDDQARAALFDLMYRAGQVDALIAFVPEASMGTAIEMWQAYQSEIPVLTVSPLTANWVVRFLSTRIFDHVDQLAAFLQAGDLRLLLKTPGDSQ